MKNVISAAVCALLLFPSLGFAGSKDNFTYISFSGMVFVAEDSTLEAKNFMIAGGTEAELDVGLGFSVAVGKKAGNGWRGELEYSYRKSDTGDLTLGAVNVPTLGGEADIHIIMANGVYDITNNSLFTPYLGADVGWEEEAEGAEFAYQLLAGINYEVAPKADLILGYRYTGMTDLNYEAAGLKYTATVDTHNFELGFRHSF